LIPNAEAVGSKLVECLSCGATRRLRADAARRLRPDECGRCGYVGWAEAESVTEALRRALRETAVEGRRLSARNAVHFAR
jgi:ribosomal protein S27AE